MRLPLIILSLAVVAGAALFFLLREPERGESLPTAVVPAPASPSGHPGAGAGVEASGDMEREAASPIVGRKPYDTGIRHDGRVRTNREGKRVLVEGREIAERLHHPDAAPEEDLENLEQLLGLYRLSFEQNPVAGDNQMVMEALLGDNPRKLVVFPPDHPSLDAGGQLLDRWGTPYFFHALSGTEMEIFSAGPDRTFNTADDVQWTHRGGKPLTGAGEEPPEGGLE